MRTLFVRLTPAVLAVVLLFGGGWLCAHPASPSISQVSAIAPVPSPTATFFSELGSGVARQPRESQLPVAGTAGPGATPWPKLAGAALALGGAALVFISLRMRPQDGA